MKLTKFEENLIYILSGFAAWIAVRKDIQIKYFSALCVLFFAVVFGPVFALIDIATNPNISSIVENHLLVITFMTGVLISFPIASLVAWLIVFIVLTWFDKGVRQSSWMSSYNNRNSVALIFFARMITLFLVFLSIASISLPILTFLAVPAGLYALCAIPLSAEEKLERKKKLLLGKM